MNNLAIIPARGGSKRIPKKNIKNFLGEPIISYSINSAIKSKLFDRVLVSTDDVEIAELSTNIGADVPFLRSAGNSGDFSTTIDVLFEVLNKFLNQGIKYDNVCCIYPCAPFIKSNTLLETFSIFIENKCDSLFPIVKYSNPIQRSFTFENGLVSPLFNENINARSQDLVSTYFDAGQFYWLKSSTILEKHKIFTDNSFGYIISELEAQDIDNESDWEIAELKYKLKNK